MIFGFWGPFLFGFFAGRHSARHGCLSTLFWLLVLAAVLAALFIGAVALVGHSFTELLQQPSGPPLPEHSN